MKKFFQGIRNWYLRLSPQAKPGIISIALVIVIIIITAIALLVSGCDFVNQAIESAADSALASVSEEGDKIIASVSEEGESVIASVSDEVTPSDTAWPSYGVGEFDLAEAWASEGDVVILNDNIPYFSEEDKQRTDAFEEYSELDDLGRCGVAYANVCVELQPTEARGEIGSVKPSGWHSVKYPELISDKYLYNRCHLIGFQLAGENANPKNLVTGTRYLNVTLMLPYENAVDDFLETNPDMHILYRVTPVFDGDDLVCKGLIMEGWSVEDNGDGVCFCIFVKNVQPGITIDYATGDSYATDIKNED